MPSSARTLLLPFALACLLPGMLTAQAAPRDVRNRARSAETGYERVVRWLAPSTFSGGGGSRCDEVVGRFCLTFDTLSKPPDRPERPEVGKARLEAIAALTQYFDYEPGTLDAAAPLVRLLIEDGRPQEAVAVARRFAVRTDSLLWRDWLLGYTLHAVGDDGAADSHFERALARLPGAEREDILSIDWLLDPQERDRVGRLDALARDAYVRRFWAIADPRAGTTVNEARVQHIARHVEARIRSRIPRVRGMVAWGRDLDELTVRYGSPVALERVLGSLTRDDSYIEHFDTAALALAPRALLRDSLAPPRPGERWQLAERAPRSAHAIPALASIVPLSHQLTRYPRGDSMLVRIDAGLDSAGASEAVLVVLNRTGGRMAERRAQLAEGEHRVTLELLVPRDTLLYGAEIHDSASRRLHRARYTLEPLAAGAIQLSDLRLTEPLSPDSTLTPRPLTDLQLEPAQTLALHAEVHGLAPGQAYEVAVGFVAAEQPGAVTRGLRWLGAQLGLVRERSPARVRWADTAAGTGTIAVNVTAPAKAGYWLLEVQVRSEERAASASRLVRVTRQ